MFYTQFSKIIKLLNSEFVEEFDYWLATLPINDQKNITASAVSARLGVKYSVAEAILTFAEKEHILEKYYLVKCPDCDCNLISVPQSELASLIVSTIFCEECEEEKCITIDCIYTAYKVILKPDVSEDTIAKAIEQRLNPGKCGVKNFTQADSLSNHKTSLYEAFYNPSESAYNNFKTLRSKLDLNYGKNSTAKGKALEILILEIFKQIKYIKGTNSVQTGTNQFDCTMLCGIDTCYLSIFSYLSPYFIVECKNEKKKPDNNYANKLESIMDTNEAQIGIIFGRKDARDTCFTISREHYLLKKESSKNKIIITCWDQDLDYIIDKRVNLLSYLEFKIFQITANSPTSTFEIFSETDSAKALTV